MTNQYQPGGIIERNNDELDLVLEHIDGFMLPSDLYKLTKIKTLKVKLKVWGKDGFFTRKRQGNFYVYKKTGKELAKHIIVEIPKQTIPKQTFPHHRIISFEKPASKFEVNPLHELYLDTLRMTRKSQGKYSVNSSTSSGNFYI